MGKGSGKGGAVAKDEKRELLIDGQMYDITSFIKKHPGGRVLTFYEGTDASEAYNEFHMRSKKANKFLKALPSRPAEKDPNEDAKETALIKDFQELREEFRKEGMFEPDKNHVYLRLAEVAAMHVVGFCLLYSGYYWGGLSLLGLASGRCGWLMHEGGHYSLTGDITMDRNIQKFVYGFGCGMSGAWWRNQHNKHHATPQKKDHCPDLNTMPLVAFNKVMAYGKSGKLLGNKLWVKHQAVLFAPVVTLLVALGWQLFMHPRHVMRTKNWDEGAYMMARYAFIWATFGHLGMGVVIPSYLFYNWCAASYIFMNFAVSHTHLEVLPADQHVNWVVYSSKYTMNCENTWWCNWWMSYLNFQIEHHLFPSMPQFRMPLISDRVRALFEKHGYKYDSRGYFSAMKDTFNNLHNVGSDVFLG
jgi:fatty acid desaturase